MENRVRARSKGDEALGVEKARLQTDEVMKELEKLHQAQGLLRVQEKPESRGEMLRREKVKEKALEKKFED